MLIISQTHLNKIESHGTATYPEECCGALLGLEKAGDKTVQDVIPIDNVSEEDKKRRFMITASEYQRVEKEAKEKGLQLLGFYHSHPDHPAEPSETDLQYAWPVFSYMITSICDGVAKDSYSYVLDLDAGRFKEENLRVL